MNFTRVRLAFAVLIVAIVGFLGVRAIGQAAGPAPVNVATKAFPITVAAGDYELINQVLELPAGSGVPKHIHGGPVVATVISGELTLTDASGRRVLKAGQSLTEKTGYEHAVANRSTGTVRLAVSYLIPKGGAQITIVK
jgi:quercetin dioxygenase-like cupin family protein